MNYEKQVYIDDYYLDENTRHTTIASRHYGIVRGLVNATDNEIETIKRQYIEHEKEYARPINKIRRIKKGISQREFYEFLKKELRDYKMIFNDCMKYRNENSEYKIEENDKKLLKK